MLNPIVKWGFGAAAMLAAGAASAIPLNGSIAIGSAGVLPDTGSLATLTTLTGADVRNAFFGVSSGSFNDLTANSTIFGNITIGGFAIGNTATPGLTITGSGSGAGFGTYTASSETVIVKSASNLDLFFLGTYNPNFSGAGGTYSPGEAASFRLSVNRTGTSGGGYSVSFGGSFASPPVTVSPIPEPVSMSILGAGLLGLGLARRRKAK